MGCDLIDLRCIFVNELIGSVTLSIIFLLVLYLFISAKLKFGFETTIVLGGVVILLVSFAIGGFAVVFGFATLIIAILIANQFSTKVIKN